ncbi:MAG: carbamoyltransferase [Alphaproteobacteria bacterium]|nr:carbamoyltransferase [Alphaproteobacteria bacterium]
MKILGISAFYHDSAAALVVDGQVAAAAQEERFSRTKNDAQLPVSAIRFCMTQAGIDLGQIDHVVFYEKPWLKFGRIAAVAADIAPRGYQGFGRAARIWLGGKAMQRQTISTALRALPGGNRWSGSLLFSEHHISHAASAYFPSPFDEAATLTIDGVGEWATTTVGVGRGGDLAVHKQIEFPHSLGMLYSAFTAFTGFAVNSDEYKVMGLAPYGEPRFVQTILDRLVDVKPDGSFRLDMSYFDYCAGSRMTNPRFDALFGRPPRPANTPITQQDMDLAASIQKVTEEIVIRMTRAISTETGLRNLCLAGGVALNCVANGKVLRDGRFERLWVQPAAGDAGGALGAALACHYLRNHAPRASGRNDAMAGAFLGPEFNDTEIAIALRRAKMVGKRLGPCPLIEETVTAIVAGKVVGWFQGRAEFGPRALGARSILADPRNPQMQSQLNLKIKFRESFRPFAPAVRREDLTDWFDLDADSPYMLIVADVAAKHRRTMTVAEQALFGIDKLKVPRSTIPAVTHVDYSARIQTVTHESNPLFHDLLTAFKARTGCPVLVNTSFNVRDEPIVLTPDDAIRCFRRTEIDVLVLGSYFLRREDQKRFSRTDEMAKADPQPMIYTVY